MNPQSITLAGGCFWCLEAVYELVEGVTAVESGYSNGQLPNPSYEQVCSGTTGHAEVVRVSFDADRITLHEVLEIFFDIHDPTTPNRQGGHGSAAAGELLASRGLPPALFRQPPRPGLLRLRGRAQG